MATPRESIVTPRRIIIDGKERPLGLTPLEMEILAYLANGHRPTEIAVFVGSNRDAVDQKIRTIKDRLGANTQAGAVAIAFRKNIIK